MAFRTLVTVAALCALAPASAGASTRPNFPKTVVGSISGNSVTNLSGKTITADWAIKNVRFKLVHVRSVEGSWTGFYDVTGGTVTYKESETGSCGYSITEKFDLKPAMPRSKVSTPLALTRSLTGHDTYDGDIRPTKHWSVMEACDDPAGDTTFEQKTVKPGDLFSTGEKAGRIGRAMKGKYVYVDDAPYGKSTDTYTWSLRRG